MSWFHKLVPTKIRTEASTKGTIPEGLWTKCPTCAAAIYNKDLEQNLQVCPKCAHHFRMSAADRLRMLFDGGEWTEHFPNLTSNDPLSFTDTKPYKDRLRTTIDKTGLKDAIVVGTGTIDGGRFATITPNTPFRIISTAVAPNRVASIRSNGVGAPPRCRCPSTTARDSQPVSCSIQRASTSLSRAESFLCASGGGITSSSSLESTRSITSLLSGWPGTWAGIKITLGEPPIRRVRLSST